MEITDHLLGLKTKHLQETWTDTECEMVFRIGKIEMQSILSNFDIDDTQQFNQQQ